MWNNRQSINWILETLTMTIEPAPVWNTRQSSNQRNKDPAVSWCFSSCEQIDGPQVKVEPTVQPALWVESLLYSRHPPEISRYPTKQQAITLADHEAEPATSVTRTLHVTCYTHAARTAESSQFQSNRYSSVQYSTHLNQTLDNLAIYHSTIRFALDTTRKTLHKMDDPSIYPSIHPSIHPSNFNLPQVSFDFNFVWNPIYSYSYSFIYKYKLHSSRLKDWIRMVVSRLEDELNWIELNWIELTRFEIDSIQPKPNKHIVYRRIEYWCCVKVLKPVPTMVVSTSFYFDFGFDGRSRRNWSDRTVQFTMSTDSMLPSQESSIKWSEIATQATCTGRFRFEFII
jgi:hypothetical protein